jgi:hypothetical protein
VRSAILVSAPAAAIVCGVAAGATIRPTLAGGWGDGPLGWSADGARLLVLSHWDPPRWRRTSSSPSSTATAAPTVGSSPRLWDEDWDTGGALSPDGRRLLVTHTADANNGGVPVPVVRDLVSGSERVVIRGYDGARGIGWSPDGRRVLVIVDGALLSMRPDGNHRRRVARKTVFGATYLRDGSILVVRKDANDETWVEVVGASGGRARRLTAPGSWGIAAPAPDGRRALLTHVASSGSWLFVVDIGSGARRRLVVGDGGTWSPDGRRIVYAGENGIGVVNADGSGAHIVRRSGHLPLWSPRGDLIAFADRGECNEDGLFTMRPNGRDVRRLTQRCRLLGTQAADTIAGTNSRDVIRGLGGDDRIDANPGDRYKPYYGYDDADDVDAGPGDDVVFGERLDDNLRGGPGNDRLDGGTGSDRLDGGAGNDTIEAGDDGERDRGFAVVAEEVRKLAAESHHAALSIGALLEEIRTHTQRAAAVVEDGTRRNDTGVETVARAREAFLRIGASVDEMSARVTGVSAAIDRIAPSSHRLETDIDDVAAVAEQSSAATQQVAASTQETTAATDEIASSAGALAQTSDELAALVRRFTLGDD